MHSPVRYIYLSALVLLFLGALLTRIQHLQAQTDTLRHENAVLLQRSAALADSTRHLIEGVAARTTLPDADAIEEAVSERVADLIEAQNARLRDVVRFVQQLEPVAAAGTLEAAESSNADTLHFTVRDSVSTYRVEADLTVHVDQRTLGYNFRLSPDPMSFGVYTVERGGFREVWVEGPGFTQHLETIMLPEAVPAPPATRRHRLGIGMDVSTTPVGEAAETGLYYETNRGPLRAGLLVGGGVYQTEHEETHGGPVVKLSMRMLF